MPEVVETVTVGRELRPARVAFLVDPSDLRQVRTAIGHACALWGGALCPLVPVMPRRPPWWGALETGEAPTAAQIVEGYLRTYDPDWIVPLVDGYKPPLLEDRIASADANGIHGPDATLVCPLQPVVVDAYERRFRFHEIDPPRHVIHDPSSGLLLGDVLLGHLGPEAASLRAELASLLGTESVELDAELAVRAQIAVDGEPTVLTPLEIGTSGVLYRHRARRWRYVYFCSLARAWDAIELWNLRAASLDVVACPLEWLAELEPLLDRLLVGEDVLPLAARRLTASEAATAARLASCHGLPLVPPPVFWSSAPAERERPAHAIVSHDSVDCTVRDEQFQVPLLNPRWSERQWPPIAGSWINELELHDDITQGELASIIPSDTAGMARLLDGGWSGQAVRVAHGRIVTGATKYQATVTLRVPTGVDVTRQWFAERGVSVQVSDPGRTALEIARRAGGLLGLHSLLGPERLRMLEEGTRRHHLAAQRVAQAIGRDGIESARGALWRLTTAQVLRAGLLVQCPRCRQTNFTTLQELDEQLRCERCLESFAFPADDPPRRWAYKPVGPFAVPQYAAGAYAVLLALRALEDAWWSGTWAPSMDVEGLGELDFVLWRRPRFLVRRTSLPTLVLGEAKSFDVFAERDVERMVRMRSMLGEGYVCFATLREALTPEERTRIADAAAELAVDGEEQPPVMILTATELWSDSLYAALRRQLGVDITSSEIWSGMSTAKLCTVTQRLHLGSR